MGLAQELTERANQRAAERAAAAADRQDVAAAHLEARAQAGITPTATWTRILASTPPAPTLLLHQIDAIHAAIAELQHLANHIRTTNGEDDPRYAATERHVAVLEHLAGVGQRTTT